MTPGSGGQGSRMHVFSAHAAISIAAGLAVFVVLALLGLPGWAAAVIAVVVGPVIGYGLLAGPADRLEHWLTTMR